MQEGAGVSATYGQARTYQLSPCDNGGINPACGGTRKFGTDPMDAVVLQFLNSRSLDPMYATVADSVVEPGGPEHSAPIIRDAQGRVRLGPLHVSDVGDSGRVTTRYPALAAGETYVGSIHSHPGRAGSPCRAM